MTDRTPANGPDPIPERRRQAERGTPPPSPGERLGAIVRRLEAILAELDDLGLPHPAADVSMALDRIEAQIAASGPPGGSPQNPRS